MKQILLYTKASDGTQDCVVGKLWVRPVTKNEYEEERPHGGIIEIRLHALPLNGVVFAQAHVSCHKMHNDNDPLDDVILSSEKRIRKLKDKIKKEDETAVDAVDRFCRE